MSKKRSFQLFEFNARRLADKLDGKNVLDSLSETYQLASSIWADLRDCRLLRFLDTNHLLRIAEEGHYQANSEFWYELNRLLIASCLGEANFLLKIIDGMAWAFNSRNEIIFALGVRSYIEHTSAINDLSETTFRPLERISKEVWPAYPAMHDLQPNPEHLQVRDDLIRFVMGRFAQLDENTLKPDNSNKGWERFNDSLHKVPDKFKVKHRIMSCIDALCKREDCRLIRTIYELLSEYCHPNSASRNFGFQSQQVSAVVDFGITAETDISTGLDRLFSMSKLAIPVASQILQDWFKTMSRQRLPMHEIRAEDKVFKPGRQKVADEFGRMLYIEYNRISDPGSSGLPLTEAQMNQLREICDGFSEVDHTPFSKQVESFQKEPDPQRELTIERHLLDVYQKELENPSLGLRERKLIYLAIRLAATGFSRSEALSQYPVLKSVPDLKGLYQRVKQLTFD